MGFAAAGVLSLAVSTGAQIHQSEQQRTFQKRTRQQQKEAQDRQLARAVGTQRLAQQERDRANRRGPNIPSLLDGAQQAATAGPASTLLTGARGVRSSLLLGQNSLLG